MITKGNAAKNQTKKPAPTLYRSWLKPYDFYVIFVICPEARFQ